MTSFVVELLGVVYLITQTAALCPQIPSGCQADQVIRLQGKGIRRMNSYSYGDHYVHIQIKVPT